MKARISLLFYIILFMQIPFHAQDTNPEVTAEPDNAVPIDLNVSVVNAYFETDVIETNVGLPIDMNLIVEMPGGYAVEEWDADTLLKDPFQIIEKGDIDLREQGNLQIQEQKLKVAIWNLDNLTTSEVFLTYTTPNGEKFRTPVTSVTINVTGTRAENDVALRPTKPLKDLPYIPPVIFAIPVTIFIILILLVRNIQFNRRFQRALAIPNSPVQQAVIGLKHLIDAGVSSEEIYPIVADEVRNYLMNQFQIRALDMTTAELMTALKSNPIFSESLRTSLFSLLEQADLVKFASHHPVEDPETIVKYAIHWIEQAEKARISHE